MDNQPIWSHRLQTNPTPSMLSFDDEALQFFAKRDLLDGAFRKVETLWDMPEPQRITQKQLPKGHWKYPGKHTSPHANYNLLETYRQMRILVEMYGCDVKHPAILPASEYIFSCQTEEGDIRGILGNQYMPYYMGAILELLIKAGLGEESRVKKGLKWLLSMRQEDGGWLIPMQTVPAKEKTDAYWRGDPLPPDKSKPSSHLATGMVIRAFAAHDNYQTNADVMQAGDLLKSRFFKADKPNHRFRFSCQIRV